MTIRNGEYDAVFVEEKGCKKWCTKLAKIGEKAFSSAVYSKCSIESGFHVKSVREWPRWCHDVVMVEIHMPMQVTPSIPANHVLNYIAQVLGVIVALLEDPDESVQLTAVQCLLSVLSTAPEDAVDPILLNLSVQLRNLQFSQEGIPLREVRATATNGLPSSKPSLISYRLHCMLQVPYWPPSYSLGTRASCFLHLSLCAAHHTDWVVGHIDPIQLLHYSTARKHNGICMNEKMRSKAFAAYGALSKYAKGSQHQAFLEQVHATIPRLILHLHDDDLNVRQSCRITLRQLAPLIEVDGFSNLFHKQVFSSDRRSDYEDFIRDLSRHAYQFLSPRVASYLTSLIQAFDSPWPVIQANAVYFSSCLLSLAEDQRLLAPYCSQVFPALVNKMSKSRDAVVRAACSFALGILIKAFNPLASATPQLDQADPSRSNIFE
ncbi:hypothetical protein ZIOFF_065798 [Zingiber officinale]|uniref:Maestro/Maestro-like HEAT-repeats domain-containing protein n=1 Tax=Zingiber officinale TaxID=94328 RepID=A0A8J5F1Q6_ZINOF|nr:hypothetical protein ZIOFF_065798 [Zingiber officinale]